MHSVDFAVTAIPTFKVGKNNLGKTSFLQLGLRLEQSLLNSKFFVHFAASDSALWEEFRLYKCAFCSAAGKFITKSIKMGHFNQVDVFLLSYTPTNQWQQIHS